MASREEDNKLESNTNVNNKQESNSMFVYKKYECILKNKLEPFPKKIESLIEIWRNLGQCNQQNFKIAHIVQIMDWAKLHTLNIVLTGKWKIFKNEYETTLLAEVEKTQNELMKINNAFSQKFQKLADVIKNPWDDPILTNLLQNSNASIGEKEIEFFRIETAYLISVRLKKLCESQCEDLALNLVSAYMNCYNLSKISRFNLNVSKVHILFCYDIHITLLYRYNKMSEIIALIKKLSLEEGLDLVQRFSKKRVKISKVWRNYCEITFLAAQVFVTAAVTKPVNESAEILKHLITVWIDFSIENLMIEKLEISLRRIIQAATAAQHIYICCEIFHNKFGVKLKTFTIEMYIRALTTDMNNLESQKTENEVEKIKETTKRLASGFLNLADILKDTVQVSRECALTSFSLEPTLERLRKLEDLARLSGFNVLDTGQIWECKLHPPAKSTDEIAWICNLCGKWTGRTKLDLGLTTNFALSEALNSQTLGISSQLCDDLAVVLIGPRYQLFSWFMKWEDLHKLCEMYLNDMERTKNLVTELKFIDIDYSKFASVKKEPIDELSGIERGYENFLQFDEEKIINTDPAAVATITTPPASLSSSQSSSNCSNFDILHEQLFPNKSDPKTLKSLRMFRHNNVKKNKSQVSQVNNVNQESNNVDNCLITQNLNILSENRTITDLSLKHQEKFSLPSPFSTMPGNKFSFSNSQSTMLYQTKNTIDNSNNLQSLLKNNNTPEIQDQKQQQQQQAKRKLLNIDNLFEGPESIVAKRCSKTSLNIPATDTSRQTSLSSLSYYARLKEKAETGYKQQFAPVKCTDSVLEKINLVRNNHSTETNSNLKGTWLGQQTLNQQQHSNEICSDNQNHIRQDDIHINNLKDKLHHRLIENGSQEVGETKQNFTGLLSVSSEDSSSSSSNPQQNNETQLDNTIMREDKEDNARNLNHFFCSGDKPKSDDSQKEEHPTITTEIPLKSNETIECDNELPPPSVEKTETTEIKRSYNVEDGISVILSFFEKFQVGSSSEIYDPAFKNHLRKLITGKSKLKSGLVQNENSSNNANCCIPSTNQNENILKNDKMNRSHFETSRSTQKVSLNKMKRDKKRKAKKWLNNTNGHIIITSPDNDSSALSSLIQSPSKEKCRKILIKKPIHRGTVQKKEPKQKICATSETIPKNQNDNSNAMTNRRESSVEFKLKNALVLCQKLTSDEIRKYIPNYKALSDDLKSVSSDHEMDKPLNSSDDDNVNKARILERIDYDKVIPPVIRSTEVIRRIYLEVSADDPIWGNTIKKPTPKKNYNQQNGKTKRKKLKAKPKNKHIKRIPRKEPSIRKKCLIRQNVTVKINKIDEYFKNVSMNPKVVLERLKPDPQYVRSILSNVPGLNDYEMMRPVEVNPIVNVVQISGGRPTSSVPVQNNTQTSTQITPHIQRIGQPRLDKPENSSNEAVSVSASTISASSSTTTNKPATTAQPSALINILSQQIIRPSPTNNCVRNNRNAPVINILSQQIIRPATVAHVNKTPTNFVQAEVINSSSSSLPKVLTTVEQQTLTNDLSSVKTVTTNAKTTTNPQVNNQGTILQFICKSTLPKFQQAFGKTVYQNNSGNVSENERTERTETTTTTTTLTEPIVTVANSTDTVKKSPTKHTSAVNIQSIQGSVIYTRQMPVGQAINILPQGRGQVFRIATSNAEQISLVKDTVIHSKMSALLAAALQGKQKSSTESQSDGEATNSEEQPVGRVNTATRSNSLVQNARIVKPVLQIPSNVIRTSPQSNLSSTTLEQLREFDMVYKQIKERSSTGTPSETNTTSDSNENTSQQKISVTYLNNQGQKFAQLSPVVVVSSYCNLQPAASPALSVTSQGSSSPCVTPAPTSSSSSTVQKIISSSSSSSTTSSKPSKGKTVKNTTQTSKASPIPKPQQKPQEDEHTTQRIFDILAEYAEQLRNSPDLNNKPAPRRRSNPPTNPSHSSKRKKSSSSKKSLQCNSSSGGMVSEADVEDNRTVGSEDSSCGIVQISVQEEEQLSTSQKVQTITSESNDSTSGGSRQQLILTDASSNQTRNLIIADSSVGEALKMPNTAVLVPGNYIMPVSMVKGGQQIAVVSGGSKILATVPARSGPNMLLFQSFLNQNRNKTGTVPTVKYSTIQPISGISSQNITGINNTTQQPPPVILPSNSHNITAVTLSQPITLKKIEEPERVNTELLLTISQPRDNGNSSIDSVTTHPANSNTITSTTTVGTIELEETIINSDNSTEKVFHTYQKSIDAAGAAAATTTTPIATPVIAQTSCAKDNKDAIEQNHTTKSIALNVDSNKTDLRKSLERAQTVLVTACTSNGPMLSHTTTTTPSHRYHHRKTSESAAGGNNESSNCSTKEEFLHNGEKQNNNEQKQYGESVPYFQNKDKKTHNRIDCEIHQLCLQRKQAAIERELRLQKSLSEECEDLGVDEPSTSDLFPEADILFDSNHSPPFDATSSDIVKKTPNESKDEENNKAAPMALFNDDDSSSLRTDFLFESVEYHTPSTELEEYEQSQQQLLTNGQSSVSNESRSSCGGGGGVAEDHTLLRNCTSMSDVTLSSPISPDPYDTNTPPPVLNKYKFKYSNRKKNERHKEQTEQWTAAEVSSSEDTTGSTELGKSSSHSPEPCSNKRSHSASASCDNDDEQLSDGSSYKVVQVISKSDLLKDDETYDEIHYEDDLDCSPSGRGARRSVKKMCSCCNGLQEGSGGGGGGVGVGGASPRKRSASRSHTPVPHKKAFLNKKR